MLGHVKGIVHEVGENATVKVRLPNHADVITDWLPVAQSVSLDAKSYVVPRKGTQVIVIPGNDIDDAVVICSIYSKPDPAPFEDAAIIGMVADDGVEISYDPGASLLKIQSPKEINIIATNIKIKADIDIQGDIKHKGDQNHTGDVTHQGDVTQTGNQDHTGNVTQIGNLDQAGAITTASATIGGIVFAAHKHVGVILYSTVMVAPVRHGHVHLIG